MAIQKITIQQFFTLRERYPVLDVRSPGEFTHAHIPGAFGLPLFSDEERKVVGTAYKQLGKQKAIKEGLAFYGSKMLPMVEEVEKILLERREAAGEKNGEGNASGTVIVHCWRGGMRSAAVAWLLDLYGFQVYTLTGGYKSFRRWCGQQFLQSYPFSILGGFSGSDKTGLLEELEKKGQDVIDLEALAGHKGSVFGHLGEPKQDSQEMFENRLALALSTKKEAGRIWLEDESQRIGSVNIPTTLYRYIQTRPIHFLEVPFEERLNHIVAHYGKFNKEQLADGITRIRKRLGGLEMKTALQCLETGDITECFRILLKYYDKYYSKSLGLKQHLVQSIKLVPCIGTDATANAQVLLKKTEAEIAS